MKHFVLLLILTGTFSACNNKNKSAGAATGSSPDSTGTTEGVSPVQKKVDALEKMTAYSIDEMKALLPIAIAGDTAKDVSSFNNMGTGFAKARYAHDDSTSIEVNVFDCGGSAGAGLYSRHYQEVETMQDEYTKIGDFKGEKTIEHLNDGNDKRPVLTYIANGRLLVTLEGENLSMESLKSTARNLSLKP